MVSSVSCKCQKHRRIKDLREFYGIIDAGEMETTKKKPCTCGRAEMCISDIRDRYPCWKPLKCLARCH